ncbi:MAG TPA: IMP dehydrogenase, partial [Cryobacterium sp.]|nr:IMP dehydrogenase [Cryobacterium sp.]
MGPGSICTTRVVADHGNPCRLARQGGFVDRGDLWDPDSGDGGLQYSGDIAKALVAGADT